MVAGLLVFTPQADKPCTCPASKLKKEPRVSNRDLHGLMDGGSYMSEARSWGNTPPGTADGGQDKVAVFAPGGKGRLPVTRELMSGWLISYQGN